MKAVMLTRTQASKPRTGTRTTHKAKTRTKDSTLKAKDRTKDN